MQAEIGDGSHTLFWKDRWLHGQRLVDIASRLVAAIPKRRINQQTVQEALFENRWALDIQGTITVGVLHEYLKLWEELQAVELQLGVQDIHFWRFAENRQYSAKHMRVSFRVQFSLSPMKEFGKPGCHLNADTLLGW
jgi:hypothetical protein